MSPLDWVVVCCLPAVAAWPAIASGAQHLLWSFASRPAATPSMPAAGGSTQEWRQAWASTLIELVEEIEVEGRGPLENPEAAARLARELLWQIIGGGTPAPTKK